MMRVLVLSFYFPPDLSAGSFRAEALVEALSRVSPEGTSIDLYASVPNRYRSFAQQAPELEQRDGLRIRRIPIPLHSSGVLDQSLSYGRFARQVIRETTGQRYDVVFATSSRLLTAALGARCARRMGAPLYLDIRDVFPETVRDLLKGQGGSVASRVFGWLEGYAVRTASAVNLVSPGFSERFRRRYPQVRYDEIPNGIDRLFLEALPAKVPRADGKTRVLYAGNIGAAQGLHEVLPPLVEQCGPDYEWVIVGDGGTRAVLEQRLAHAALPNVRLLWPVARRELPALYADADVLFLHLMDWPALAKVIPSKLFEYAATGKPILAGVTGQAEAFLRSEVGSANVGIFAPRDVSGAGRTLAGLCRADADRSSFRSRYERDRLMERLASNVVALAKG